MTIINFPKLVIKSPDDTYILQYDNEIDGFTFESKSRRRQDEDDFHGFDEDEIHALADMFLTMSIHIKMSKELEVLDTTGV